MFWIIVRIVSNILPKQNKCLWSRVRFMYAAQNTITRQLCAGKLNSHTSFLGLKRSLENNPSVCPCVCPIWQLTSALRRTWIYILILKSSISYATNFCTFNVLHHDHIKSKVGLLLFEASYILFRFTNDTS